jgi:hypothetical protein
MLLQTLINPKPKIIAYFAIISSIFMGLPYLINKTFCIHDLPLYHPWLLLIFSIFIVPLHAFGLNNLIYKNNIIKKENLIIATVFVLLNSLNIGAFDSLISSFLMLFVINYLFESYQKDYPFKEVFSASLILAIIVYLNPIMLIMYLLILFSGLVFNYANWRILVVSIIGFCIPYILYIIYLSLLGKKINISLIFSLTQISLNIEIWKWINEETTSILILLFIVLISFFEFFNWLYKKSIRSRKSFFIILLYFLFSLLICLFGSKDNWYILISPLSVFIANYFTYTKNRSIANILFYILIISSCYYRYTIVI